MRRAILGAALVALALSGCGRKGATDAGDAAAADAASSDGSASAAAATGKLVVVTDANFAEVTARGVALVDFYADSCPPCRIQGPIVEALAPKFAGRATVAKLDVYRAGRTATKFGVRSIPTLIIFKDGKEVKRLVGLTREKALAAEINAVIGR